MSDDARAIQRASENGQAEELDVDQLQVGILQITLIGRSPLICHSKRHLAGELRERQGIDVSSQDKERDTNMNFRRSLYPLPPDDDTYWGWVAGDVEEDELEGFGHPAVALRKAMIRGAKNAGLMPMTDARSALFVYGTEYQDYLTIQHPPDFPRKREDTVSLPKGGTDLRYRGDFPRWMTDVVVEYDMGLANQDEVGQILRQAGFGVGIGDWRPEKDGQFGRFRIASDSDLERDWYEPTHS